MNAPCTPHHCIEWRSHAALGSPFGRRAVVHRFGFCGNKRIVLYDTLLEQASPLEVC